MTWSILCSLRDSWAYCNDAKALYITYAGNRTKSDCCRKCISGWPAISLRYSYNSRTTFQLTQSVARVSRPIIRLYAVLVTSDSNFWDLAWKIKDDLPRKTVHLYLKFDKLTICTRCCHEAYCGHRRGWYVAINLSKVNFYPDDSHIYTKSSIGGGRVTDWGYRSASLQQGSGDRAPSGVQRQDNISGRSTVPGICGLRPPAAENFEAIVYLK